jgi:hypothetical protein
VHPIERNPTGRLREHSEAGYAPVSVGLENQAAKVARIELVLGSGIEDNRRLAALLDRQFSLFCRQRIGRVEFIRVIASGEPGWLPLLRTP